MVLRSLKTKLILATSVLIVLMLSLLSSVFIYSKISELKNDIYLESRSFAELTAAQISSFYDLYLSQGSFLSFNKEMVSIFSKNKNIQDIRIFSYEGSILYDSQTEKNQIYNGKQRILDEKNLLEQIKSKNISIVSNKGQTAYLKQNLHGDYIFVDENEDSVNFSDKALLVQKIIIPYDDRLAIEYTITYDALRQKVVAMLKQTLIVTAFALVFGVIMSYIFAGKIVRPIKVLTQGVLTIAQGDFSRKVEIGSRDEVGILARSFNQMAHQLNESTKAIVFQERIAKEFELAAEIQKSILPSAIPKVSGLDLAAGLIPAEAIGGDLFDFVKVNEDNLILYIGDVTGHGVPASLVVSIANSVIYSHRGEQDMARILTTANAVLKAKTLPNMFLTLLMMNWNISAQKMTYVNAGHEQLIYYSAQDKKVTLLPPGGMALGMIPDISKIIRVNEINLNSGDVLVTYSDGIPECWRDEKEMYGMAKFKQLVAQIADLPSAEAIKNAIIADVKLFANGYEQKDDITVMVVKKS